MTSTILIILGGYFGIGLIALGILDFCTGRVQSRIKGAAADTQTKLTATGNYVGRKASVLLIIVVLWLLWPVAIFGALTPEKKEDKANGTKRQG